MIASYLIDAARFLDNPLVQIVALLLAGWAGWRLGGCLIAYIKEINR
jgi:hypothetical protein